MPKPLLALLITATLTGALFVAVFAKGQPTTHTLPVAVDGITRTLTVVLSDTDVLSATVAPISDTFKATATAWLNNLADTYDPAWSGATVNITATTKALEALLAATDKTAYPRHWTPFVRQYRFAIHTCRHWLTLPSGMADNALSATPWLILRTACYEQYQDAYVEMERIAVSD